MPLQWTAAHPVTYLHTPRGAGGGGRRDASAGQRTGVRLCEGAATEARAGNQCGHQQRVSSYSNPLGLPVKYKIRVATLNLCSTAS